MTAATACHDSEPGRRRPCRRSPAGGLLALLLAAVAGCGDGTVVCSPCSGATSVDLTGWWDGTGGTPTALRVCLDGRCQAEPLGPGQLGGANRRVGVPLGTPGSAIGEVDIDLMVGDRSVARAVGRDLVLPTAPPSSRTDCDCWDRGSLALDPVSRRLVLRPASR